MASFVLATGERVVRTLRPSKIELLPHLMFVFATLGVPWLYFKNYTLPKFISLGWKIWAVIWIVWLMWRVVRWALERYIITNRRLVVIKHHSPLERSVEETPLERILNVGMEKVGILDLFFGLGTVLVRAVGLEEPLKLRHVSRAAGVVRNLWQENQRGLERTRGSLELPEGLKRERKHQYLE